MEFHRISCLGRLFDLARLGASIVLAALLVSSPGYAEDTCPCFAAEEIAKVCESIGGVQAFGPSRGWGGVSETEGAAVECSSPEGDEGAYFEVDSRSMDFSSTVCTKIISRGTQDDIRHTEGIFEEHLVACRQQLDSAAELLGGLAFLSLKP